MPATSPTVDHRRFASLLIGAKRLEPLRVALVHPVDRESIESIMHAHNEGLVEPVLVGPRSRILEAAQAVDIRDWELVDTEHSHAAAEAAVAMAAAGRVDALMKGKLHTDELLHPVVKASSGLRTERRISHAYVLDVPTYHKPLIISDAAVNIAPDLSAKADICRNAIALWGSLFGNLGDPKLAVLSAVETVHPDMPSTIDAAALCKMAERGQIQGASVDGPLAYDNIIDRRAADEKGIQSVVAGDADIVVAPNIETGNSLAKQLIYLGDAQAAGLVLGARVPIILTSRADSIQARLMSCVLALYFAHARRQGRFK